MSSIMVSHPNRLFRFLIPTGLPSDIEHFLNSGASRVLVKPVSADDLNRSIGEMIVANAKGEVTGEGKGGG